MRVSKTNSFQAKGEALERVACECRERHYASFAGEHVYGSRDACLLLLVVVVMLMELWIITSNCMNMGGWGGMRRGQGTSSAGRG